MAFVNLPLNFQDILGSITDRIAKLETGPNQALYVADAAQGSSAQALSVATNAQIQAINAEIEANNAASQATIAQSQATIASTQATQAQTTADGKNKIYYSTSTPGSTANQVGDIWYQYGTSGTYNNKVIAQWSGAGGTSWTSVTVSGLIIANIDAGTITTGVLNAIEINAGSGGTAFHVSPGGYMAAQGVYVKGNITADSGTFNGTINAGAGYFGNFAGGNYWSIGSTGLTGVGTAAITAGAISGSSITTNVGTIAGWSLASTGLSNSTGNTIINNSDSTPVAFSTTRQGIFKYLQINGASGTTLGSATLAVGGIITVDSDATIAGNIRSVGTTNTTTGATANMYINPTSGLMARSTSSLRYKLEIEEQSIPFNSLLSLTPKSFVDKNEAETQGTTQGLKRLLGLIAEEVAEIPVLKDLLVVYDEEGRPDAINYDRLAVALLPLIQNLTQRVNALENGA